MVALILMNYIFLDTVLARGVHGEILLASKEAFVKSRGRGITGLNGLIGLVGRVLLVVEAVAGVGDGLAVMGDGLD